MEIEAIRRIMGGRCAAVATSLAAFTLSASPASALIVPRISALPAENCLITEQPSAKDSDILLGGVPSRLEAIRLQQAILPAPESTAPVMAVRPAIELESSAAGGCTGIGTIIRDANAIDAIKVSGNFMPDMAPPAATDSGPAITATPIATPISDLSKPDIFGSVALAVSKTPLDGKWKQAGTAALSPRGRLWRRLVGDARKLDRGGQIELVNQWVNRRVRFADDAKRYAANDRWASAAETLRLGIGDCEDYAIAKMKLLEIAGVARSDMFLVVAKDLVRRADHALLVVRDGKRLVVLDNMTDTIVDALHVQDYRPILSYSAGQAWVHGYDAAPPPPVRLALLSE